MPTLTRLIMGLFLLNPMAAHASSVSIQQMPHSGFTAPPPPSASSNFKISHDCPLPSNLPKAITPEQQKLLAEADWRANKCWAAHGPKLGYSPTIPNDFTANLKQQASRPSVGINILTTENGTIAAIEPGKLQSEQYLTPPPVKVIVNLDKAGAISCFALMPEELENMQYPAFRQYIQNIANALNTCQPFTFLPQAQYTSWQQLYLTYEEPH